MADIKSALTLRIIVQMTLVVFAAPLIPMIVSHEWAWWQAWTYVIASAPAFIVSRILAGHRHPGYAGGM